MTSTKPTKESIGSLRLQSDLREIGALMMFTGICAILHPIGNVVSLIGPDGTTPSSGIGLSALFAGLILITIGVSSIFIGYNQLVHGWGNKYLTAGVMLFSQSVYTPYVTDMTMIGRAAKSGMAFIPASLNPSASVVRFVGACGICGVLSYGFAFAGAISFFQFALYAYQNGKYSDRAAPYYAGRLGFYCGMLLLAGVTQFALAVVLAANFGAMQLEATVGVAMFVINYPIISMVVGFLQIYHAVWGIARSMGYFVFGKNDMSFQGAMFMLWLAQLVLQVIVQVGIGGPTPAGAGITALTIGLNLMPAYLDYKARTLPQEITLAYYGLDEDIVDDVEAQEQTSVEDQA